MMDDRTTFAALDECSQSARQHGISMAELALGWLRQMLGNMPDWTTLENFLPPGLGKGIVRRSAVAATFAASLELVKAGEANLQQAEHFAPLYLRDGNKSVAP